MGFRKATTKGNPAMLVTYFNIVSVLSEGLKHIWSLAKTVVPNRVLLVSSVRRERGRGRVSLGAEAFLELPAVSRPPVLQCALPWIQHSPSLGSPRGPHVHPIPGRKFWVLWLCEVRHHVGCLNVLLVLYVNLRSLTLIPFKVRGSYAGLHKKPQSPFSAKLCDLTAR